ncbi:hypothetical protein Leryth_010760 [Lithospermum erythrorhizon]|nr:hypothetical protein Leryth_010760 [Lithospermum erythrorhizon]
MILNSRSHRLSCLEFLTKMKPPSTPKRSLSPIGETCSGMDLSAIHLILFINVETMVSPTVHERRS